MIDLKCPNCAEPLAVPGELAGDEVQCPECGRLIDVPRADELDHLDEGGFRLAESEADGDDAAGAIPLASPGTLDYAHVGNRTDQRDRRNTLEQFLAAGTVAEADRRAGNRRPVYDPETGELVRPLDVAPDVPVARQAIPVDDDDAAPAGGGSAGDGPRLNYAAAAAEPGWTYAKLPLELLQPANAFVLFVVFVLQVALAGLTGLPVFFLFFFSVPWALLAVTTIGHFANVVQDVGYEGRDELPAPLRGLAFYDDFWKPFTDVAGALMLCFAVPAVAAAWVAPDAWEPAAALGAAVPGLLFFPAVLLTMSTSGTVVNLLPQFVVRVILAGGLAYAWAFVLGAAALGLLGLGLLGVAGGLSITLDGAARVIQGPLPPGRLLALAGLPMLAVGTYVGHLFAATLGLIYRRHHRRFGWAGQEHIRRPREDVASKLAEMDRRRRAEERRRRFDPALRDEGRLQSIRVEDEVRAAESARRDAGLTARP